jgi:hypothetical protein
MDLGEYINRLEKVKDKDRILKKGLGKPHSWRGSDDELAFDIVENISIQEMLDCAKDCIGKQFTGYKGGDYIFDENTTINIDSYGDWTDEKKIRSFLSLVTITQQRLSNIKTSDNRKRCRTFEEENNNEM